MLMLIALFTFKEIRLRHLWGWYWSACYLSYVHAIAIVHTEKGQHLEHFPRPLQPSSPTVAVCQASTAVWFLMAQPRFPPHLRSVAEAVKWVPFHGHLLFWSHTGIFYSDTASSCDRYWCADCSPGHLSSWLLVDQISSLWLQHGVLYRVRKAQHVLCPALQKSSQCCCWNSLIECGQALMYCVLNLWIRSGWSVKAVNVHV